VHIQKSQQVMDANMKNDAWWGHLIFGLVGSLIMQPKKSRVGATGDFVSYYQKTCVQGA